MINVIILTTDQIRHKFFINYLSQQKNLILLYILQKEIYIIIIKKNFKLQKTFQY